METTNFCFLKGSEILDRLSNCELIKKYSAAVVSVILSQVVVWSNSIPNKQILLDSAVTYAVVSFQGSACATHINRYLLCSLDVLARREGQLSGTGVSASSCRHDRSSGTDGFQTAFSD